MKPPRKLAAALGSRLAGNARILWSGHTARRSLVALEVGAVARESIVGCPRWVLAHTTQGREAEYWGYRSLKQLEEHARALLLAALSRLEAGR